MASYPEQSVASGSKPSTNAFVQMGGSASDLSISLHPLPILNISDHHTRNKLLTASGALPKIFGALLGTQSGREVSIVNTFDLITLPLSTDGDVPMEDGGPKGDTIDLEFLVMRKDQFKQVFPTLDLIGWYSTGDEPTVADVALHKQLLSEVDSPLFLLLSPSQLAAKTSSNLPVRVFESAVASTSSAEFVEVEYAIETGEAERIAVDGAATGGGDHSESSLAASLTTQRNAVKMLMDRIQIILEYVDKVSAGKAPVDHAVLRQIKALIATLPAMNTPGFQEELHTENADNKLTSYLSSLTKQLNSLNDLSDKHLSLHQTRDVGGEMDMGGHGGGRMIGMPGSRRKQKGGMHWR